MLRVWKPRIQKHVIPSEAVRLAVMAFAAQQALIRKEQEDEHLASSRTICARR